MQLHQNKKLSSMFSSVRELQLCLMCRELKLFEVSREEKPLCGEMLPEWDSSEWKQLCYHASASWYKLLAERTWEKQCVYEFNLDRLWNKKYIFVWPIFLKFPLRIVRLIFCSLIEETLFNEAESSCPQTSSGGHSNSNQLFNKECTARIISSTPSDLEQD